MAEKTVELTSSMTSVTEEDDASLSESDTTETTNSYFSSLLNSTDENTDDKLTPSLHCISISSGHCDKKEKPRPGKDLTVTGQTVFRYHTPGTWHTTGKQDLAHPGGNSPHFSHPLSQKGDTRWKSDKPRKCNVKNSIPLPNTSYHPASQNFQTIKHLSTGFTADCPRQFYTDFSNNNVKPTRGQVQSDSQTTGDESDSTRRFLPDMSSPTWFTAKVFDSYWSHYNFAMDWFKEHVKFVQAQFSHNLNTSQSKCQTGFSRKNVKLTPRGRRRKRARKKRSSKTVPRQKLSGAGPTDLLPGREDGEWEDEGDGIEMEITEDMVNFFSHSYKHRLERDKVKKQNDAQEKEAARVDIEQAIPGRQIPSLKAPSERPGVKRTQEMRLLYGKGAAMIHGMETALQMTFDRFTDRHQPKLWPNMPLKMSFS